LKDIISVVDSCHFNYFEEYCPVLLKLGRDYDKYLKDETVLAKLAKTHKYQLQIWRKNEVWLQPRDIYENRD